MWTCLRACELFSLSDNRWNPLLLLILYKLSLKSSITHKRHFKSNVCCIRSDSIDRFGKKMICAQILSGECETHILYEKFPDENKQFCPAQAIHRNSLSKHFSPSIQPPLGWLNWILSGPNTRKSLRNSSNAVRTLYWPIVQRESNRELLRADLLLFIIIVVVLPCLQTAISL